MVWKLRHCAGSNERIGFAELTNDTVMRQEALGAAPVAAPLRAPQTLLEAAAGHSIDGQCNAGRDTHNGAGHSGHFQHQKAAPRAACPTTHACKLSACRWIVAGAAAISGSRPGRLSRQMTHERSQHAAIALGLRAARLAPSVLHCLSPRRTRMRLDARANRRG
jgi:hypothetical protein